MSRLNIFLPGFIKLEFRATRTEERSNNVVDFGVGKTVQIEKKSVRSHNTSDTNWRKGKQETYFMPKHRLEPFENGTKFRFMAGVTSESHRSGRNSSGWGKTVASRCA